MLQISYTLTVDLAEHEAFGVVVALGDAMGKHWRGNDDQLFTIKARLVVAAREQRTILLACGQRPLSARALDKVLSRLGKNQGAENEIARTCIQ